MAYYCALDFWDVVVLEIIVVNGYALWRSGATGSQEWRVLLLWVYSACGDMKLMVLIGR